MIPTRILGPLIACALFASSLVAFDSCATTQRPGGVIKEAVGITADCAKAAAGPIVANESAVIVSDLTSLDFNQVRSDVNTEVQKLTAGGLALETAWQIAACLIGKVFGEAQHDATAGDSLAARRVYNARLWLDEHQVTFAGDAPSGVPSGMRAVDAGPPHQAWPLQ
jgi:hypothetical protein